MNLKKTAVLCLGLLMSLGVMAAAEAGSGSTVSTDGSFSADSGKGGSGTGSSGGYGTSPGDAWGSTGKTCAPVPEPATWAMMIVGLGLLATTQFRRRGGAKTDGPMVADGALI